MATNFLNEHEFSYLLLFMLIIVFVFAATIIQIILFFFHWLFYKTLAVFLLGQYSVILTVARNVLFILSLTFLTSSLIISRYYNALTRAYYIFSATWLGVLFFFILASVISWLVFGLAKLFSVSVDLSLPLQILLIIFFIMSLYSVVKAEDIKVTRLKIGLSNLPSVWQGKTAVWISDSHLGQIWNYNTAKKIADKIQSLKPEVVFIGGDLYDGVAVDVNGVIEPLAELRVPRGVYFITGNHEEFSDNKIYLAAVKRAGMKVLNNELVNLGGLQLVGVDYRDSNNREKYKQILNSLKIDQALPSILLKHVPDQITTAEQAGISLQLSGHAHHGQMYPLGYIHRLVYRGFDYGLKKIGEMQIYTSSGVGTWGPPLRFGTESEIVQITFGEVARPRKQ